MGLRYKLFMPKPIKRAWREVTSVAHPVRTARRAVTPRCEGGGQPDRLRGGAECRRASIAAPTRRGHALLIA